jgi:hypothetical protein
MGDEIVICNNDVSYCTSTRLLGVALAAYRRGDFFPPVIF